MIINLDFVALVRTHPQSSRNPKVYRYFDDLNRDNDHRFELYIVNGGYHNSPHMLARSVDYVQRVSGHHFDAMSADLVATTMFGLDFVLSLDPVPRWTLVTTSDAFVNKRELPGWLDVLNAQYDVDRDWAFIANGLTWGDEKVCYPQGGSGYLLSRFTVAQITATWASFLALTQPFEDLRFGEWLAPGGGAPGGLTVTNRMIGHYIKDSRGRCKQVVESGLCPAVIGRLREVVVWHYLRLGEQRTWEW
jgi:hypothetical protein